MIAKKTPACWRTNLKRNPFASPQWNGRAANSLSYLCEECRVFLSPNLFVFWQFFAREDRVRRANRNASTAVHAFLWVDVQLHCFLELRFVLRGMNAFGRTLINAQGVLSAGIHDYMGHGSFPFWNFNYARLLTI